MGFSDSIKLSSEKIQGQVNNKIVEIATELFNSVIEKTPVSAPKYKKRGELINNYYLGLGLGNYNKSYTSTTSIAGMNSRNQVALLRDSKEFVGKDGAVSLTNSTPYATLAEYVGWASPRWHNSPPYAMVRNSLTAVASKYKR